MKEYKFILSPKHLPCIKIAETVRGFDYKGMFEIHVTVQLDEQCNQYQKKQRIEDFQEVCINNNLKCIMIELSNGEYPSQLMTSSYHHGIMGNVHIIAFEIAQLLAQHNFRITRTKIEAMFSNKDVPIDDEDSLKRSPENYFEFHYKTKLPIDSDLSDLVELCDHHDGHLSRNALKVDEIEGYQTRFVTQRMYYTGKETARARFEKCKKGIESAGFEVLSNMREYSVYDSNVNLDLGWIEKP
eukprot:TRINITY_DN1574_c0_g1_i4.p1 TRINITY_DN1574_c0_g1~~TRINITY_DN1574_c0_g1_i4.p1  ORF type:complete len:242 (+),score=47.92 TRINITY_DN1574_c0_g1_i4:482-1207(+)